MRLIKDICRVCMQITPYEDLEEINLDKLGKQALLPELDFDLFTNHLICQTCISIFRTLNSLKQNINSSNALFNPIMSKWNKDPNLRDTLFDLKTLSRFRTSSSDICRICLRSTKIVAVYLFENSFNLFSYNLIMLMMDYINLKLNYMDKTLNPILCHKCLQQIEAAYSFRKQFDQISIKIEAYLQFNDEYDLTREDLQEILDMWDELDIPIDMNEPSEDVFTSPYEEHNYSKQSQTEWETFVEESADEEMSPLPPLLSSLKGQSSLPEVEMPSPPPLTRDITETPPTDTPVLPLATARKGTTASPLTRSRVKMASLSVNMPSPPRITRSRSELSPSNSPLINPKAKVLHPLANIVPAPRLTRSKVESPSSPLTRSRAVKPSLVAKMSSSSLSKPRSPSLVDKSPTPSVSTRFTPESPPRQQEEMPTVKNEPIDQDDEFHEEGTIECPDLTSFIKTEPEEVPDHEQPPVLEFQGLCNYGPRFTIADIFSVDERCNELRTREEKRSLFDNITESDTQSNTQVVIKLPKLDLELLQNKNTIPTWNNKHLVNGSHKPKPKKKARKLLNILKQPSRNNRKTRSKFSGPPKLTPVFKDFTEDKKKPLDENGKMHFCSLCDFSSTKHLAIKAHETRHVSGHIELFSCGGCSFKTSNKKRLKKHGKICKH